MDWVRRTYRAVAEAAAVCRDSATLGARKELTAVRHPGTAGNLREKRSEVVACAVQILQLEGSVVYILSLHSSIVLQ